MAATPIPQELTTAWQLALEFWNQPARHDTLLGLAAKHSQFAWLAARYKDAAWSNPADTVAPVRLARVQRAAAMVMLARTSAVEETRKPYRMVSLMLVGCVLATCFAFFATQNKVEQHQRTLVTRHP